MPLCVGGMIEKTVFCIPFCCCEKGFRIKLVRGDSGFLKNVTLEFGELFDELLVNW
jgi:hypothetical protein